MIVQYRVRFGGPNPTFDSIAERFYQGTGIAFTAERFAINIYLISAKPLKGEIELTLAAGVSLKVNKLWFGYLEWALLWTLRGLGGDIPARVFPAYARVPWASLSWHNRLLHR